MRNHTFALIAAALLVFTVTACNQTGGGSGAASDSPRQALDPSATPARGSDKPPASEAVRVSVPEVTIAAGRSAEAVVNLKITDGYHINANPPSMPNLIATELAVEDSETLSAGRAAYPRGQMKRFEFSDKPLSVYEGTVEIKIAVTAAAAAPKGSQMMRARLRVQPCDETVCYPPRTIELSIPVTVQ